MDHLSQSPGDTSDQRFLRGRDDTNLSVKYPRVRWLDIRLWSSGSFGFKTGLGQASSEGMVGRAWCRSDRTRRGRMLGLVAPSSSLQDPREGGTMPLPTWFEVPLCIPPPVTAP